MVGCIQPVLGLGLGLGLGLLILLIIVSHLLSFLKLFCRSSISMANAESRLGITVERSINEARIVELGIRSWPKWGCPPSKFLWTYDALETFYLVKGRVKVYPEGSSEYVEIGAGDLVVLPKGMCCTWDVVVAVDKYYKFDH